MQSRRGSPRQLPRSAGGSEPVSRHSRPHCTDHDLDILPGIQCCSWQPPAFRKPAPFVLVEVRPVYAKLSLLYCRSVDKICLTTLNKYPTFASLCHCCCLVAKTCLTLASPWTVAHQASLSMGFPRQEHWSGLPCPSPGDLPDPEIEPTSPELAGRFFTTKPPRKPPSLA